jgi:hypothetical protein
MKRNIKKTAFSLVELSMILLFIGILISGVVFNKSNIFTKARLLYSTSNTTVSDISDLALWLDVANKDGFNASESINGASVSLWKNMSPQNYGNIDVQQTTASAKPTYALDSEDGLPMLSFDGGDSLVTASVISGYEIAKAEEVTIFFVQKYTSGATATINWQPSGSNRINTHIAWNDNTLYWDFVNNRVSGAEPAGFDDVWNIIAVGRRSSNDTGFVRVNGGSSDHLSGSMTASLGTASTALLYIHNSPGTSFIGDMREVIIFKRELTTSEINEVEEYLSNKWDIDLN